MCLKALAPSWMTRVWYCSLRHMGHVFRPVNLSNACRQACNEKKRQTNKLTWTADRVTGHSRGCAREWACPKLQGRKEMFYLMTYSTHFIYGYMASGRKEGNVLFNDALNTFYLRLNCIRKEENVLFNDALNTFYLQLYGIRKEGRKCFI